MTAVVLKLGTVLVVTFVFYFAFVLAFLALAVFARFPLSPYTAATCMGASPVNVEGLDCHDRLATE